MSNNLSNHHLRWLAPPLTEVVFLTMLLWLVVGGQARALLSDGDTGWHIRTGQFILTERRFPTQDLFSYSRPGAEWFAWEWGADVLFALAHRAGGLQGVVLVAGVLIAATSATLFAFLRWQGVSVVAAVVVMLAAGSASTVHWLARPHLFTCFLFVVTLWMLEADRARPGRRLWWLAPLAAVWVNLHGGFVALSALVGAYAAGEALGGQWRAARRYAAVGATSLAATLANPYGYRLHLHIARYLSSDFIRDRVEEFQSPRFRGESMLVFEALLVAGLLVIPGLWRRRAYGPALVLAALAHAALGSVRHVLLYVVAAAPLVAAELERAMRSSGNAWLVELTRLGPAGGDRTGRLRPPLWGVAAVVAAAVALGSGHPRWQVDFPKEKFPLAALTASEKYGLGRRLFTSDQWADYLIYRNYPQQRVFFDGRSDFYGAELGRQYLEAMTGHHRWEQIFDRNGFDVALVPAGWPLATVLKAHPGWRLDYDDGQALVLRRVGSELLSSANTQKYPAGEKRSPQ